MRAASRFATDFSTYDYRHIDADFARVAADATGSFKRDFLVQSAGARDLLVKAKAVSNTEVVRVATVCVESRECPQAAEILVALNRTVFNTQVPNGRTDAMGLDVTLVRHGTGWLASGVKPL
jgi:Mce-associated membrane protein